MTDDLAFLTSLVDEERVALHERGRRQYESDASPHEGRLPEAVVWPETTAEVSAILSETYERGIPVTPWSGGSGLEGGAIPAEGGLVLVTDRMTDVEVRPADMQAVVEPGIVYDDLNERLARHGLRFSPGISSGDLANVGGMIATNASGFNTVRYGETGDHVLRLEVVLPDGEVIECGRDVVKTSSGYSLKDLFVGSEGTLGVITEATLSLDGRPEHRRAALVSFPSAVEASRAVSEVIQYGLEPGAIEFLDTQSIEMVNAYSDDVDLPAAPTLILELHGNNSGIEEDVEFARGICADNGATRWEAAEGEEIEDVWQARRDALPAFRAYREDVELPILGDVVVPISNYPDIVEHVAVVSDDLDLVTPCVGHAGDGNLHFAPLVPADDDGARERADELNERVVRAAIEMGGTATGEHGVGLGKRKFMSEEHGRALDVMADLKRTVDPKGLMNPGKVLPQ